MKKRKTIVLTGGGTAGHVMPNLALVEQLQKHFDEIHYIGTESGIEKKLVEPVLPFHRITACKLVRSASPKNLLIPFKLLKSVSQSKKILKELNADVVFSKGGFVALPVAMAAKKLKIPVVSHESDISMGLANKLILRYCNTMCVSFEKTQSVSKKCVLTGNPLRNALFTGKKEKLSFSVNSNKPTVLFFGGSLGAKAINQAVWNSLDQLLLQFNVIHIVGKNNRKDITKPNYFQLEFTNQMADVYDASDLVVCRSGANSIFELLALKKPMLLIPLSKEESRGDQIENANYFQDKEWAHILLQEELTSQTLLAAIERLKKESDILRKNMASAGTADANQNIVQIILNNYHA